MKADVTDGARYGPGGQGIAVLATVMALTFGLAALVRLVTWGDAIARGSRFPGGLALGIVYCAPGLLGVIALRRRPALLCAAGLSGFVLGLTAVSGVSLLMWLPSALYLIAYARLDHAGVRPRAPIGVVVATTALCVLAAFWVLVLPQQHIVCSGSGAVGQSGTTSAGTEVRGKLLPHELGGTDFAGVSRGSCVGSGTGGRGATAAVGLIGLSLVAAWGMASPRPTAIASAR